MIYILTVIFNNNYFLYNLQVFENPCRSVIVLTIKGKVNHKCSFDITDKFLLNILLDKRYIILQSPSSR